MKYWKKIRPVLEAARITRERLAVVNQCKRTKAAINGLMKIIDKYTLDKIRFDVDETLLIAKSNTINFTALGLFLIKVYYPIRIFTVNGFWTKKKLVDMGFNVTEFVVGTMYMGDDGTEKKERRKKLRKETQPKSGEINIKNGQWVKYIEDDEVLVDDCAQVEKGLLIVA